MTFPFVQSVIPPWPCQSKWAGARMSCFIAESILQLISLWLVKQEANQAFATFLPKRLQRPKQWRQWKCTVFIRILWVASRWGMTLSGTIRKQKSPTAQIFLQIISVCIQKSNCWPRMGSWFHADSNFGSHVEKRGCRMYIFHKHIYACRRLAEM